MVDEPLGSEAAVGALRQAVPDLDKRIARGDISFAHYQEWYDQVRAMKGHEVLAAWMQRIEAARNAGHSGLRVTGNTQSIKDSDWDAFMAYESPAGEFKGQPIVALCSYCLDNCNGHHVLEVAHRHDFVIARRDGGWQSLGNGSISTIRGEHVHGGWNHGAAFDPGEGFFRDVFQVVPAAIYTTDADGRLTFYNETAAELWGRRPQLGTTEWCGSWRLYWPDGRPMPHDECPMAVALKTARALRGAEAVAERPDGSRFPFLAYPTPLHDSSGRLIGAVNMLVDVTEKKAEADHQNLLLRELSHRVRNSLGVIQSMAHMTLKERPQPGAFAHTFIERLRGLATSHDLLTGTNWRGSELEHLIRGQLAPYVGEGDKRLILDGPAIFLPAKATTDLGLILNELATNAAKYGSLSTEKGSISIIWRVDAGDDGQVLHLIWMERGGPSVSKPKRRGFGSKLIEGTVEKVERRFEPEGLVCSFDLCLRLASQPFGASA